MAQAGKISAAARLLHLSQPAVTAQVRKLEAWAGGPVFLRTPRGVELNAAGRTLLRFAIRQAALLEQASAAIAPPGREGELVVGASTTIASYVLPDLLASFFQAEGRGPVRLEVGNSAQVLEWVEQAKVPLGLVEGPSHAARLRLERFLPDELLPVVSREAAPTLARLRHARELVGVPLLWREPGSGSRTILERVLRRALGRRRPHHPGDLQLGSSEAIKRAAILGLGVGFLSRWSARAELAFGRLRPLSLVGFDARRDFSWVLPAGEVAGRAGQLLRHGRRFPPALPALGG